MHHTLYMHTSLPSLFDPLHYCGRTTPIGRRKFGKDFAPQIYMCTYYIYIYIYIYMYVYVHTHTHPFLPSSIHYIIVCVYIYIYLSIHPSIYLSSIDINRPCWWRGRRAIPKNAWGGTEIGGGGGHHIRFRAIGQGRADQSCNIINVCICLHTCVCIYVDNYSV